MCMLRRRYRCLSCSTGWTGDTLEQNIQQHTRTESWNHSIVKAGKDNYDHQIQPSAHWISCTKGGCLGKLGHKVPVWPLGYSVCSRAGNCPQPAPWPQREMPSWQVVPVVIPLHPTPHHPDLCCHAIFALCRDLPGSACWGSWIHPSGSAQTCWTCWTPSGQGSRCPHSPQTESRTHWRQCQLLEQIARHVVKRCPATQGWNQPPNAQKWRHWGWLEYKHSWNTLTCIQGMDTVQLWIFAPNGFESKIQINGQNAVTSCSHSPFPTSLLSMFPFLKIFFKLNQWKKMLFSFSHMIVGPTNFHPSSCMCLEKMHF